MKNRSMKLMSDIRRVARATGKALCFASTVAILLVGTQAGAQVDAGTPGQRAGCVLREHGRLCGVPERDQRLPVGGRGSTTATSAAVSSRGPSSPITATLVKGGAPAFSRTAASRCWW